MRLDDLIVTKENLDGDELYIIKSSYFNVIKNDPVIDGISLGGESLLKLLWGMMEFVEHYKDFSLALYQYKIGALKKRWLFTILLRINNKWQRVHVERLICDNCGWEGKTANPTEPSLYDTVPNKQEALNEAWSYNVVPCPKCGSKLPRHPIWVQPLDNDFTK